MNFFRPSVLVTPLDRPPKFTPLPIPPLEVGPLAIPGIEDTLALIRLVVEMSQKERFDMGPPYQTSADNDNLVVGTPWPALDSLPFVQLMTEHYNAMNELGTTCMRLIALGLQLDVELIATKFSQPVSILCGFHYIQIFGERAKHDEVLLYCRLHIDNGALTFIGE